MNEDVFNDICQSGDLSKVQQYLSDHENVDVYSGLMGAMRGKYFHIFKFLKNEVDLIPFVEWNGVLLGACEFGDKEFVEELVDFTGIQTRFWNVGFGTVCGEGDLEKFDLFIQSSRISDADWIQCLRKACIGGKSKNIKLEVIRRIIQHGTNRSDWQHGFQFINDAKDVLNYKWMLYSEYHINIFDLQMNRYEVTEFLNLGANLNDFKLHFSFHHIIQTKTKQQQIIVRMIKLLCTDLTPFAHQFILPQMAFH